jgi:putative heme transporter
MKAGVHVLDWPVGERYPDRIAVRHLRGRLPTRQLRVAGTLAVVAAAAYGVATHGGAIGRMLSQLRQVAPGWVAVAVLAEALSLFAYTLIVRRLLRLGEVEAPVSSLLGMTFTGIAILNSVPGGQALSSLYWFQQLRRYGAGRALAAIVLAAASLIGLVTLLVLTAVGIAINGPHGFLGSIREPLLIGAGALLFLRVVAHRQLARAFRWLARRIVGPDEPIASRRVSPAEYARLMLLGYANWALDCVALLAALMAVHVSVDARAVLLAYLLGQLVAALPLLPGGGGSVEATLALGLISYGGTQSGILAGVILFRIISAWGLVPLGWAAWALTQARPKLLARRKSVMGRVGSWSLHEI